MNVEKLLEAGVHFGHRVTKWNPRMAPYIYGERNGIHILDVIQTMNFLEETSQFLEKFKNEPSSKIFPKQQQPTKLSKDAFSGRRNKGGGKNFDDSSKGANFGDPDLGKPGSATRSRKKDVLFVGTKKQASQLIRKAANTINGYSWITSANISEPHFEGLNAANEVGTTESSDSSSALRSDPVSVAEANEANDVGSVGSEIGFEFGGSVESKNSKIVAHYVNHRWLGGLLTNWSTMKICIQQLNDLEKRNSTGEFETLPKKERSNLKKDYEKLMKFFGGIKNLKDIPDLVFIIGQDSEMNAVRECLKLQKMNPLGTQLAGFTKSTSTAKASKKAGNMAEASNESNSQAANGTLKGGSSGTLRTITLLDTNCDPELADLFIPANDDSAKSLNLLLEQFTKALSE